ncbi:3-hydroxy-3-methylglutaryl-coenzyme A reductase 2 [Capsicum chinense]|nr:3-hydroxy-3-methylglutaryl-coenzyme A reductase 2 [Capsicum chinense]
MLKNRTCSAMDGVLGGYSAHASNIVSTVSIATGHDPAQNFESSRSIIRMEDVNDSKDLHISVTMPSIKVGTVGGGTQLSSQSACLNLLGVIGANREAPGSNARLLATIVAGSVLAGELSLMSATSAGQLTMFEEYLDDQTSDPIRLGRVASGTVLASAMQHDVHRIEGPGATEELEVENVKLKGKVSELTVEVQGLNAEVKTLTK